MQVDMRSNIAEVLRGMDHYRAEVVDKAIQRALNRTMEQARTATSREIRAQGYNLKAGDIKAAIRLQRAGTARLRASINISRRTISLMDFGARQTKDGVSVNVHQGRKVIKHAFVAQLRNGRKGVYIEDKAAGKTVLRTAKVHKRGSVGGWQSLPARKLMGPSVGGVYGTDRILSAMQRLVAETFQARLRHEVMHLSRR